MVCKNCGKVYSDYRSNCPRCGYISIGEIVTTNKDKIKGQEKWFSFFALAPKVFALVTLVLSAISGIVWLFIAIFQKLGWFHYIFAFSCILVGALLALLVYVCLKLSFCYKILHIEYLKKIVATKQGFEDNKEIK